MQQSPYPHSVHIYQPEKWFSWALGSFFSLLFWVSDSMFYEVAEAQLTLKQEKMSVTKSKGKSVIFTCTVSGLSTNNYIHWYQKKEDEAFKRVLYINYGGATIVPDNEHPQKEDFSAVRNTYNLKIDSVKMIHAATYYCAAWESVAGYRYKVFGSGTKLIVTETPKLAKAPEVIAYPPSSPEDVKKAFLCIAKGMFPDVVKFSWRTKKGQDVTEHALTQTSTNEKHEITHIASILITNEQTNDFECTVAHEADSEGRPQTIAIPSVEKKPERPKPTCPPQTDGSGAEEIVITDGTFELTRSLYLANLTYTLMILKSVAYFAVASLLAYKRS